MSLDETVLVVDDDSPMRDGLALPVRWAGLTAETITWQHRTKSYRAPPMSTPIGKIRVRAARFLNQTTEGTMRPARRRRPKYIGESKNATAGSAEDDASSAREGVGVSCS